MAGPFDTMAKALESIYLDTAKEGLRKATLEREAVEAQIAVSRRLGAEMLRKARAERQAAEENLKDARRHIAHGWEGERPCREMFVSIEFDSEKGMWKAYWQGVEAYGDTPEMACDNFDHLWMFG